MQPMRIQNATFRKTLGNGEPQLVGVVRLRLPNLRGADSGAPLLEEALERQVQVPVGEVEPVADDERRRDAEPDVLEVELDLVVPVAHEQRAHLEARRSAREQVPPEL